MSLMSGDTSLLTQQLSGLDLGTGAGTVPHSFIVIIIVISTSRQCILYYHSCHHHSLMHTRFLVNRPIFPELFRIRPVSESHLLGIVVAEVLQADDPSHHPTNSIKALKDG